MHLHLRQETRPQKAYIPPPVVEATQTEAEPASANEPMHVVIPIITGAGYHPHVDSAEARPANPYNAQTASPAIAMRGGNPPASGDEDSGLLSSITSILPRKSTINSIIPDKSSIASILPDNPFSDAATPAAAPVQAVQADQMPVGPPKTLLESPGIVIKKEVIHLTPPTATSALAPGALSPEQLAALMPAAGGDNTTPLIEMPTADQSNSATGSPPGTVPEIAVSSPPATPPPVAAVETTTAPLPSLTPLTGPSAMAPLVGGAPPITATTLPPPPVAATAAPAAFPPALVMPTGVTPVPANPPTVALQTPPKPSSPPAVSDNFNAAVLDNIVQKLPEPTPKVNTPPENLPPVEPKAQATAQPKPKQQKEVALPAAEEEASSASEPTQDISKQSKQMLKNIPSNLDQKKRGPDRLDVEHTRNTEYLKRQGNSDIEDTRQSEAMGIKIEVKNHKADFNYELQKAYDALITGHTEAAISIYKNVIDNDPDNKNALFGLATTYHRAGQIDMARPLYSKLLALDPGNRDALNNFLVLLADESPQEALVQLEELAKRNPDFSPIPAQIAVIYQKQGNSDKASEYMFRAISLAPENLTYRYNLAIMLDKQKNYDEAAKLYHQIVEAHMRGEVTPGNIQKIQERLTFIGSNKHIN